MEITYTQNEISEVAEQILTASASNIFLLYGEMGVGKTTLIKEIVRQLGVLELSGSPSFSIVNEYEAKDGVVYHFDFYRITNIEEAYDIGVEDYFYSGNFIFIEWPEKIIELLPESANSIYIIKNNNGSRTLKLMPVK
ncbi:tRNA (adenosine(37)-N6)-threonylcarbamoyltransferase complex ATPase subunit type 1 TsaE [Aequorivita antarctica]|uniref:tRNA threonylcarbamoyladenosine biosynthesis protein TsaE n=1 Tax=Aequorivita antarctica TaxID=153266 RepID=A0A5C6Z4U2_9FLAO|nr:tRNA (adenosine(37)-N6)-threonylcarbamoyltransferase complex ATPase subunit type 1 TsaE [Aequorivita antarctica]TXD74484.1 tRNA (adenosine(37)-N6)-threonylcarbamoyltransferase complex ATPase subunit type 1 TsaE [Aequorivita antarctica]SRX73843.1 tRNA threonylcarbamoyladenosine biosynthesis protein TsaE [Aequorivita antarctica]